MTRSRLATVGLAISLAGAASPAHAQRDECQLARQRDGAYAGECLRGEKASARLRLKPPQDSLGTEWRGAAVFGAGYPMPVVLALQGGRGALRLEQPWRAVTGVRRWADTLRFSLNADTFVEGVGTAEDVRILRRVLAMWPDSSAWARGPGTDCSRAAAPRSLWCALHDASIAEIGEFQLFRPAVQEVRWSVFHLWKRSYIEHPLRDPNAAAETTFEQIRQLVIDAMARIEKDLRGEPNPRVEPILPGRPEPPGDARPAPARATGRGEVRDTGEPVSPSRRSSRSACAPTAALGASPSSLRG